MTRRYEFDCSLFDSVPELHDAIVQSYYGNRNAEELLGSLDKTKVVAEFRGIWNLMGFSAIREESDRSDHTAACDAFSQKEFIAALRRFIAARYADNIALTDASERLESFVGSLGYSVRAVPITPEDYEKLYN